MINIEKLIESERLEVAFAEVNVDKDYVKQFRKEHHLTQIALANILGVTKKTVEKWEQGTNNINGSSAVLLKLLNDNAELINQLYHVKSGVRGQVFDDEFTQIDSKTIIAISDVSPVRVKTPIAAIV